jgi:hypothetical protein
MLASFARALTDRAFWVIFATALLGATQQSAWFIVPMALLLTLFSVVSDEHWFQEFKKHGLLPALWLFWAQCLGQNVLFAGAAFVMGHAVRWLWF